MRIVILVVVVLVVLPAWASEPGQPLDCSDWVILEPGITCSTLLPYPSPEIATRTYGSGLDNEGNGFLVNSVTIDPACGPPGFNISRLEVVRVDVQGVQTVIAYVEERCLPDGTADELGTLGVAFDPIAGRLAMRHENRSSATGGAEHYPHGYQKIGLEGFTTLFDVLQSFTPAPGALGFRVPYMPEGMNGADSFNTYWGNLDTVGDWSQAQGLQCDYPTEIPNTGDYLTVSDTLPTPSPGSGYYYVTSASYQGTTRYGRKRIGGVTSGRDPAALPGCGE